MGGPRDIRGGKGYARDWREGPTPRGGKGDYDVRDRRADMRGPMRGPPMRDVRDRDRRYDERRPPQREDRPSQPAPKTEYDLPFDLKERWVADHFGRHLHRMSLIPKDLLRVVCHWVDTPVGALPSSLTTPCTPDIRLKADEFVPYAAVESKLDAVDVRALIPIKRDVKSTQFLRGVDVLCAKDLSGPCLHAYGGPVSGETLAMPEGIERDNAMKGELTALVKDQMDLYIPEWTKFVEFRYKAGRRAIFFIATELDNEIRPKPQVAVVPLVATAPQEAKTEAAKEEESGAGAQPATRNVTKVQPSVVPCQNLMEFRTSKGIPQLETCELLFAFDALYEYMKREMASRMPEVLRGYVLQRKEDEEEAAAKRAKQDDVKRKRRDDHDALRKARAEEDEENKKRWATEGWGYTDDEKRDMTKTREQAVVEARRSEDKEIEEKYRATMKDVDAADGGAAVYELSTQALEAFSFFDRLPPTAPGAGTVTKQRLCGILLSLETAGSTKATMDLLSEVQTGVNVRYNSVCTVKRKTAPKTDGAADAGSPAADANEADTPMEE